jgi:hypothetical protein
MAAVLAAHQRDSCASRRGARSWGNGLSAADDAEWQRFVGFLLVRARPASLGRAVRPGA